MKLTKQMLLSVLCGLLTASTSLAQGEVYSLNIVGFQKSTVPVDGRSTMFAMPFQSGSNTLLDIFGTNSLRQSDFLSACDKVTIYDPQSQTYQRWAQWTDGKFYKADNLSQWNEGIEGNPTVPQGTGFWLSSASGNETNTILLVGNVVSEATHLTDLVQGFQIAAYPFTSDFDLSSTANLVASGASQSSFLAGADRITVYDPDTATYQRYALYTDGKWYKANSLAEWNQGVLADEVIKAGSAFWYQAMEPFSWQEDNPYVELFE